MSAWWTDEGDWELYARLPKLDGAVVDTALRAHLEALVAERKRELEDGAVASRAMPTLADALVGMAEHGLDVAAHLRPHGHRTTVVLHVDVDRTLSELHLGPALSDAERRELGCDARVEAWFERDGVPHRGGPVDPREGGSVDPGDRPASPAVCGGRSSTAPARAARSPGATPGPGCTPTTWCTGKTAAPPTSPTWCSSVRITTGPTTGGC